MSAHLIIALALAAIVGFGAGVGWSQWQMSAAQATGGNTVQPSSADAQRERREKFFSGDTDRNIRGGQELKPRW
ncbi:conjugal transfer protein TrbK 1 (plasmid) [Rhizobium gallicum]|uniref:Conjugal transfer protein TrbK 1 n=1 Tax=Rhizobium gallicum TaxID=56730 RepID=A0A1L5NPM8_9HYPH|nr:entry exclusion protein TrbK [Rhizobium gallicum]APO69865.1 conjugal transfer protein TrbK 1 [Rhizobium gallicum]